MAPVIKAFLIGGKGAGSAAADFGLAILRLGFGLYLAFGHGFAKLIHDGHFGPSGDFISATAKIGFPMPTFFAWCCVLTESVIAFMFAIGLLTRPAALLLIINMCVALFGVHLHAPWTGEHSKEPAILYLIPFVTMLFTGAGYFSADAMIRTANHSER